MHRTLMLNANFSNLIGFHPRWLNSLQGMSSLATDLQCKSMGNFLLYRNPTSLFEHSFTGPALGMFEVFGRIGPPILGGRLFGR